MSTPAHSAAPAAVSSRPRVLAVLLPVIGLALVINVVNRVVAGALGVDFQVMTAMAAQPQTVGLGSVVVMTVVPLALAGLALLLVRRWAPRSWQVLAWLGLAAGVLTLPFFLDATLGTKFALGLMHLVPALLWWAAVRRELRR